MKQKIIFTLGLVLALNFGRSQNSSEINVTQIEKYSQTVFVFKGELAENFIKGFFEQNNLSQKGYVYNIKRFQLPGISDKLNLEIWKGIMGAGNNCASYFTSIENDKTLIKKLKDRGNNPSEVLGITIIVERSFANNLLGTDEIKSFKEYINSF